jgi:hypothetical protein
MGSVYRKTATKPLPNGAEIITHKGERLARWKDRKGRNRAAPITVPQKGKYAGRDRVVVEARTYTAKYRDGSGIVREVPTGCRDETAARRVLADLERRAELVKAKVLTAAEDAVADHQDTPLADHINAYLTKLEAEGTSPEHQANVRRCLERITADCGFADLGGLNRGAFEHWLVGMVNHAEGYSLLSANPHRFRAGRRRFRLAAVRRQANNSCDCERPVSALALFRLVKSRSSSGSFAGRASGSAGPI